MKQDSLPAAKGTFSFPSTPPVELISIDLIDLNGGAELSLLLTDDLGNTAQYDLPDMWTRDIQDCGFTCDGYALFNLQALGPQAGEVGATGIAAAPIFTGAYDALSVASLEITFMGSSPSAAVDNLSFIPEPNTALLLSLGLGMMGIRRRR